MMRLENTLDMMRQIDTIVSASATVGLLFLLSFLFLLDMNGYYIVSTLLPVVAGIIGWKCMYSIYRARQKTPHVHPRNYACMECAG
jgi:hypothetical protein